MPQTHEVGLVSRDYDRRWRGAWQLDWAKPPSVCGLDRSQAYEKGRQATADFLAKAPLKRQAFLPQLNYTPLAREG